MPALRFVLDEDVSHWLAPLLRSMGFDATSATEAGRLRISDPRVLLLAMESGQTVITHNNAHFKTLHEATLLLRARWEGEVAATVGQRPKFSGHAGVLVVPQVDIEILASAISDLVSSGSPLADRLFVWSARDGWREPRF